MRFIIILLIVSGCKVANSVTSSEPHSATNTSEILFLTFKVEKDSSDLMEITLLNKSWVKGNFKEIEHHPHFENEVLEFEFLDKDENPLKVILAENPLTTSYETYSLEGTIERQQVRLTEAQFTVRTNMATSATHVKVRDNTGFIKLVKLR